MGGRAAVRFAVVLALLALPVQARSATVLATYCGGSVGSANPTHAQTCEFFLQGDAVVVNGTAGTSSSSFLVEAALAGSDLAGVPTRVVAQCVVGPGAVSTCPFRQAVSASNGTRLICQAVNVTGSGGFSCGSAVSGGLLGGAGPAYPWDSIPRPDVQGVGLACGGVWVATGASCELSLEEVSAFGQGVGIRFGGFSSAIGTGQAKIDVTLKDKNGTVLATCQGGSPSDDLRACSGFKMVGVAAAPLTCAVSGRGSGQYACGVAPG